MKPVATLIAACVAAVLACPLPAAAQWAWRDAAGRMVYSDQPPPKSVPSRDVLRQPGPVSPSAPAAALAPAAEPAANKATVTPPAAARPSAPAVADREIDARLRQQQLADAEKKAADDATRQAHAAENCERLRGYQRALQGGFRVARINAAGQQEVLDDAARASETERTRAQIEQSCQ